MSDDPAPRAVVVDDSDDLRTSLTLLLESSGWQVDSCGDANSGFELVCRERPALLVTDLMLGVTSGLDLISRVRADVKTPQPIIIACSGFRDLEREARRRGAETFISKPFDAQTILHAVATLLSHLPVTRRMHDEAEVRTRALREYATETARIAMARIETLSPQMIERSARSARWYPAYVGFGHAIIVGLRDTHLRVLASSDTRRWPLGLAMDARLPSCRDIVETGSAILVPDLSLLLPSKRHAPRTEARYFAGTPLLVGDTAIGAFCHFDDQPRRLDADDFALLCAMGRRASAMLTYKAPMTAPVWSETGRITRPWLERLLRSSLTRAQREHQRLTLFVFRGEPNIERALPPRTLIAELDGARCALVATRSEDPAATAELMSLLRHLAEEPGFSGAGLVIFEAGTPNTVSEHDLLRMAEGLCERAVAGASAAIERVILRREPLTPEALDLLPAPR